MTDVAPETGRTAGYLDFELLDYFIRESYRGPPEGVKRVSDALSAAARLRSLLLRAEEIEREIVALVESDERSAVVLKAHIRDALTPEETKERPEGREGMVTVYDDQDNYVGCMGSETWERLLVEEAQRGPWAAAISGSSIDPSWKPESKES